MAAFSTTSHGVAELITRSQLERAILSGAVIATLCLFPLLNALSSTPAWLHWTVRDSLESLVAWALLSCVVALTLAISAWSGRRVLQDAVCAAWLMVGAFFVAGAIVKLSNLANYLAAYRQGGGWIVVIAGVALAVLAGALFIFPGRGTTTRMQRIPLLAWPLIPLLLFHLVRAPGLAAAGSTLLPTGASGAGPTVAAATPASASAVSSPRTVILLFDELSPDYLYGARRRDFLDLAALTRMLQHGEIHRGAHLHGGATIVAIPALFGPTPAAARGLVTTLSKQGRSVRVWGWYHDYCAHLAADAASCHSNSVYNPRTLHEGFSVIDPVWTDLNLLPAAFPFELLKTPPAVALQRRTLDATRQWLASQLADRSADVIYAHVNVPHLPLVAKELARLSSPDAFVMSEDGYLSQFGAVDDVIGDVLRSGTRPTQLIVLSDHNARPLFPKAEHEHVVFMRLRSWVPSGPGVDVPEDAADLVARMTLRPDTD